MINLRKMNIEEFDKFYKISVTDYAKDIMNEKKNTYDEALQQAKKEFAEMLPDGLQSKNNEIMLMEDDNSLVGSIWFQYDIRNDIKFVFLCDFLVYEEHRRKGYAIEAIDKMNQIAKINNCKRSLLFVREQNIPAVQLYKKCGYEKCTDIKGDGFYMEKVI